MNKFVTFLAIAILVPVAVFAYKSPGNPDGYVNDFAGVIEDQDEQAIESKIAAFESSSNTEIAVVTIPAQEDETIEGYAVKLFQDWGIGKKGMDNGVLILIVPSERDVRIEVGYGLEGAVTDLQSANIIREVMAPDFRNNDYGKGVNGAVDALISIISKSPEAARYSEKPESASGFLDGIDPGVILFILFFIFSILHHYLSKTKSWWLGGLLGAGLGAIVGLIWGFLFAGVIATVVLTILGLIFDYIVSKIGPRPPGSHGGFWFPGSGRGGFGGGGFGGFGGGRSGGGGASGSW